ncbi:MAG: hypothetical protein Fur0019_08210 [Tibeticola sp.]
MDLHHAMGHDPLKRVLAWQITCRLMDGPIGFRFVEDSKLFATRGTTGATGNWYCGLHEVEEMAFVLHVLRPGEHFLDVGANIGSYTVLAAAGAKARVTAVEPIPETFEKLQLNVSLNQLESRVRSCLLGLSDREGVLRFSVGLDTVNHVLSAEEDVPGVDVSVTRLDDLVRGDCPHVIKIDVEGHEFAVLQGAVNTISNERLMAVIMETNGSGQRFGRSDKDLFDVMQGYGFSPWRYDPFNRRLVEVRLGSANTIFVRHAAEVSERLRSAPVFRVGESKI